MMYEIEAEVESVAAEVRQVSEGLGIRELNLVYKLKEDDRWEQVVVIEFLNHDANRLNGVSAGDRVKVSFELKGRRGRNGGRVWNQLCGKSCVKL